MSSNSRLYVSGQPTHLQNPSIKGDGVHLKYVDTIALIARITMRQRTSYPKPFKAQVVQECLQPDVSIASIALRHGINANLVRKWIPLYRDRQQALPAFVPLTIKPESAPAQPTLARIEIPFKQQTLTVTWPTVDPDGCARFIRGLVK